MRSSATPRRALAVASLALAALLASPVAAQTASKSAAAAASAASSAEAVKPVAPDSPRASYTRFVALGAAGEWGEAAQFLEVSDKDHARAAELAQRLYVVLDRELRVKVERISPDALGDANDKLPTGVDEIGVIAGRSGPEPVRMVRRWHDGGFRWIFSRSTVEHVDGWFQRLSDRWMEGAIPAPLTRSGPEDLLLWQWIALPIFFGLAWIVGRLLGYATGRLLARLTAHADPRVRDAMNARLGSPLALAWALTAVYLALPYVGLASNAVAFLERALVAGFLVAFFWIVFRSIDLVATQILDAPRTQDNAAARSLVPMIVRGAKVVVFVMAVIAALSELGYPVTSLVAGLGIGGIAVALAAQKTMENLFGSVSIGVDQPFRVGDTIQVDTVLGTVETIGLRSTRVRTPDRTVVTIPNGKLADMRIERVSGRDRIRFACTLPLDPRTEPEAMRKTLEGLRKALRDHPRVWQDDLGVALVRVTSASLDVDTYAWFTTTSFDEFQLLREDMLLQFLEVARASGALIAPPPMAPAPTPLK
jgi:MscS family membrane protein